MAPIAVRAAAAAEIPALDELIERSARALSTGFYAAAEIEAAIAHVFGIDSQLVDDGTYLVAVDGDGALLGCGGWSRRATLFGGDRFAGRDPGLLDPACDAARIRAFFVDPRAARRGVARLLLAACEARARAAGFRRMALMATLPGQPFYAAHGYRAGDPVTVDCGGTDVVFVPMDRALA